MGPILSPSVSIREVPVRKYTSIGLTTLLSLSALICLVLAACADGVGPS